MATTFVTFRTEPGVMTAGLDSLPDGFKLTQHQFGWSLALPDGWAIIEDPNLNPESGYSVFVDEKGDHRGIISFEREFVCIQPKRRKYSESTHVIDFPVTLDIAVREIFEKNGFQFEETEDNIRVTLPENWKVKPDGFTCDILDNYGRNRAIIIELNPNEPTLDIRSRFETKVDNESGIFSVIDNATHEYVCTIEYDKVPDAEECYNLMEALLRDYVSKMGYNVDDDTLLFDPEEFWD